MALDCMVFLKPLFFFDLMSFAFIISAWFTVLSSEIYLLIAH